LTYSIYADLHTHTTASDGTLSPQELIELASRSALKVIAVTDHDTIAGVNRAKEAAESKEIKIISGIELSCGWHDSDDNEMSAHVLGLYIDLDSAPFNELLLSQKQNRYTRAMKMLDLLEKENIDTSELRLDFENSPDKVLGRPHVARYLMEKKYIANFQEAFNKYISKGRPAYVPKVPLDPKDAISAIHQANGIAILAHPGLIPDWEKTWSYLKNLNFYGFETYYSEHSRTQTAFFENIINEKNWLSTGGSDYHGHYGKHKNRLGKYGLTKEQFDDFSTKLKMRKNPNE